MSSGLPLIALSLLGPERFLPLNFRVSSERDFE
jgi:hypothetical protein